MSVRRFQRQITLLDQEEPDEDPDEDVQLTVQHIFRKISTETKFIFQQNTNRFCFFR